MYGRNLYDAVIAAYHRGEIKFSEVSMHFVSEEYDKGPVFFRCLVEIENADTPETLSKRVNKVERYWQPFATNLVVRGEISWDGIDPESLVVPPGYTFHEKL